jgi:predicted deacetylase
MSFDIDPSSYPQRTLAVVIHDVMPVNLDACERLAQCVQRVAPMPTTLLAVPCHRGVPADASLEGWLGHARRQGHELALHGYTHTDDGTPTGWLDHARRRWYTAGEGEFAALSRDEAIRRLRAGQRWFRRNGWPLKGFVAPAWLMSEGTWDALEALRFDYTCTLSRLVALPGGRSLRSRSIVYSTRAAWRRTVSVPWNLAVAFSQRSRPLMRFELHPGDALHEPICSSWMRLLEQALRDRRPVTLATAARRLAAIATQTQDDGLRAEAVRRR